MSKDTGGTAFPLHSEVRPALDTEWCGMTLRDYFAAKAVSALVHSRTPNDAAAEAYAYADAMLKARKEQK